MAAFNRNIITPDDIACQAKGATRKTLDANPPAGAVPGRGTGGSTPPGGVPVQTADDYLTKLVKYVPLEVLAAYLFIAGTVDSNVKDAHDHAVWLACVLVGTLVLAALYDVRVLNVVRPAQVAMSLVGITIYVFSLGGWFATTTWYQPWYATIALPIFGLLVAIIRLKPLPPAPPAQPDPQT